MNASFTVIRLALAAAAVDAFSLDTLYVIPCGAPAHDAVNFTGMVLFILNVRFGLAKLPPVASAPSIGGRTSENGSRGFTQSGMRLGEVKCPLESPARRRPRGTRR